MDTEKFIKVGTDLEAVIASKNAIMGILTARADQETIREALKAFVGAVKPEVTITGCNFSGWADVGGE